MVCEINAALSQYSVMYVVDAKRWATQLKESAQRVKAEAEDAGKLAAIAATRIEKFQPEKEGRKQCPACWIRHARQSDLVALDSTGDKYHCQKCRPLLSQG